MSANASRMPQQASMTHDFWTTSILRMRQPIPLCFNFFSRHTNYLRGCARSNTTSSSTGPTSSHTFLRWVSWS